MQTEIPRDSTEGSGQRGRETRKEGQADQIAVSTPAPRDVNLSARQVTMFGKLNKTVRLRKVSCKQIIFKLSKGENEANGCWSE